MVLEVSAMYEKEKLFGLARIGSLMLLHMMELSNCYTTSITCWQDEQGSYWSYNPPILGGKGISILVDQAQAL